MKGNDIIELKKLLNNQGFYKGSINNKFDLSLSKAIKLYQKSAGLK